jgi:hypothetical protein
VDVSLARQILEEVARRGDRSVLVAEGLRIGGQALAVMARNMALHLVRRGIGRGALVTLRSDDLVASLCSVLATGMLGCRWAMAGEPGLAADILLDTAPEGQLLSGAVLLDESWSRAPMAEAVGMFPGPENAETPWLILPDGAGVGLSERALAARFRAEAEYFHRNGVGVVGLAGPEAPEMLLLALSTLFHGGVLVESADPAIWRAEGVLLVAGRPDVVAACLARDSEGVRFRDLILWLDPGAQAEDPALPAFERVTRVLLPGSPDAGDPVPLAMLDRLFERIEGVAEAACFMVPKAGQGERLTAFLVLEPGANLPEVTSDARIAALRLGGSALVPKRFLLTKALPRRADGSADREACRAQVLAARAKRGAAGR